MSSCLVKGPLFPHDMTLIQGNGGGENTEAALFMAAGRLLETSSSEQYLGGESLNCGDNAEKRLSHVKHGPDAL